MWHDHDPAANGNDYTPLELGATAAKVIAWPTPASFVADTTQRFVDNAAILDPTTTAHPSSRLMCWSNSDSLP